MKQTIEENYYYQKREDLMQMYEDYKRGGKDYDLYVLMDLYDNLHGRPADIDAQRREFLAWAQSRPQGILD